MPVYLDHNATTHLDPRVLEGEAEVSRESGGLSRRRAPSRLREGGSPT